ncbi:hypothetical protein ACM26W_06570 [Halomonas sp. HK25]|uniref:hypothetical protein n=1 Tax=Halomonas sp. HK25 TaxID=3394321 RepID=UPI0039FD4352
MEGSDYYRRLDGATDVFENARGGRVGIVRNADGAQGLLIAALVMLTMGLADFDLSRMTDHYPDTGMFLLHYAGWLVVGAALLMLAALWPAGLGSGWGMWRR